VTATEHRIIEYIVTHVVRQPSAVIDVDTPLVSSGLVDSFALVDILCVLEDELSMNIPAGKIQPRDMDTVRSMLATATRVGKARAGAGRMRT
jgi:acyl carrier protein